MTGDRPALTVVVMGYRDEATIVDAVASVLDQVAPNRFEVVVVTSGGDRSAARIRGAFGDGPLAVVESPVRLLPGGARNAGIELAEGDAIAFLAADCLAEPGWVAARVAAHRAGHRVVAGAMTVAPPRCPSAWASHLTLFGGRLPGRGAGVVAHPDPAAHGLSFDRAVLDRLGPFDPTRRIGEDTEAARRLAVLGVAVWFDPRVRTAHRGPRTLRALLADQRRRGGDAARDAGAPALSVAGAVVRFPVVVASGVARTVAVGWRNGRGERHRLVWCLPWLVAARAAAIAGRYGERLRAGR